MTHETIRTFPSAQAARDYRYTNGTGGWIFEPAAMPGIGAILFPPHVTPTGVFNHPFTRGQSGRLIGSA